MKVISPNKVFNLKHNLGMSCTSLGVPFQIIGRSLHETRTFSFTVQFKSQLTVKVTCTYGDFNKLN